MASRRVRRGVIERLATSHGFIVNSRLSSGSGLGMRAPSSGDDRSLPAADAHAILNRMAQYSPARFDTSFAALSDPTRRGVLEQLMGADASVTALAERFHMTLTGMRKHIGVLERAGLVATQKVGRVRTCRLGSRRLEEESAWIENYRRLWAARFDALDTVIEELKRKEKRDGRRRRE
jgi:DNA-binding transcriptional ArsR family regulator